MPRGQLSLFTAIFGNSDETEHEKRFRNYHMPRRNEHLILRYYYHAEHEKKGYEACLADLETEFYLTERRIIDILSECDEQLRALVALKPSVREIKAKAPHLAW